VRKYTIRYTSYGPPRGKLRFILHQVDGLGANREQAHNLDREPTRLLHSSGQVDAVLKQLHQTRAQEDNRCLRSDRESEVVEEAMAVIMDKSQDAPQTQMPYTQPAFGTQHPLPARPRINEDEPEVLGVNRLEPVIAGNTRREDIRPGTAKTDYEKQMGLLNLLQQGTAPKPSTSKQSTTPAQGFVQSASGKHQNVPGPFIDTFPKSPTIPSYQQPTRSGAEDDSAMPIPSAPGSSRKRARELRPVLPEPTKYAKETPDTRPDDDESQREDTTPHALECSWMKGLAFNSEALKVPKLQQDNLARATSWLKPQPGVKSFLDGNIPQLLLTEFSRMADERAAMEGTGETDESDFDPSPDSVPEELDPSPNSLPEEVDPSPGSLPQTTQESGPATSQISWPPSPEPPQQPARSRQGLPPDSSLEKHAANAEHDVDLQSKLSSQQSQGAPVIDISDDDEPMLPPSSPPIIEALADSDEEMDMEEYVPQALGEDTTVGRDQTQVPRDDLPIIKPSRLPSVVQVKETLYGKGKTARGVTTAPAPSKSASKQAQETSGNTKHTSSTSITYSIYDMPKSPGSADGERNHSLTVKDRIAELELKREKAKEQEDEVYGDTVEQVDDLDAQDVSMADEPPPTEEAPGPGPIEGKSRTTTEPRMVDNPIDRAAPSFENNVTHKSMPLLSRNADSSVASSHMPQPLSGSIKRKPVASPTKSNRRQSKKRQLKIVGFGDTPPSAVDPFEERRKEREESLRRFREERLSSMSFESRAEPTSKLAAQQDADAMDVDGPNTEAPSHPMSLRYQSLYDDPSLEIAPPTATPASQHSTRKIPSNDVPSTAQAQQTQAALSKLRSTLDSHSKKAPRLSDVTNSDSSVTVFQSFKAAYSEYTGDSKHFQIQCKQMLKLDEEDKMVPKWQWDDFIIRNRTDYKDYGMQCLENGEDAKPWHRYYKDNIRNTLYQKDVVGSRKMLQKALEELCEEPAPGPQRQPAKETKEIQPPGPAIPKQLANLPAQKQPSRKSLPDTFKKPTRPHANGNTSSKPRHSLPPRPPPPSAYKLRPSDIFRPNPSSKPIPVPPPQLDGNTDLDIPESTGNPFRDYYFAVQRSKSWVGTDEVSPANPNFQPTRNEWG
jgi:hypothetical protein